MPAMELACCDLLYLCHLFGIPLMYTFYAILFSVCLMPVCRTGGKNMLPLNIWPASSVFFCLLLLFL